MGWPSEDSEDLHLLGENALTDVNEFIEEKVSSHLSPENMPKLDKYVSRISSISHGNYLIARFLFFFLSFFFLSFFFLVVTFLSLCYFLYLFLNQNLFLLDCTARYWLIHEHHLVLLIFETFQVYTRLYLIANLWIFLSLNGKKQELLLKRSLLVLFRPIFAMGEGIDSLVI